MKASLAIIFVSLGLAAASPRFPNARINLPVHDYSDKIDGRIVGGEEVEPHSRPYQVALILDGTSFCGGSIISNTVILTAGHCTNGVSSVEVRMGAHDQTNENEEGQKRVTSTDIVPHEDYSRIPLRNDIGLVKLSTAIAFNDQIQSVTLTNETIGGGRDVTASGWGKTTDFSGVASTLRYVNLTTITNAVCDDTFAIYDGVLCTDDTENKGTCNGDSGGPLVLNTATQYQVGLTSFGGSSCEQGLPVGFTRISYFADWIKTNAGVNIVSP